MKKLVFLFLILFLPVMAWAQSEPFKGANTLVVKTDQGELFQLAGKYLIQDGWEIADSNSDFQTISTGWKEVGFIKQRMIVTILDDGIQIKGKLINEGVNGVFNTPGSDFDLEWKKSGVENKAWTAMEVFASRFGTDREYYEK